MKNIYASLLLLVSLLIASSSAFAQSNDDNSTMPPPPIDQNSTLNQAVNPTPTPSVEAPVTPDVAPSAPPAAAANANSDSSSPIRLGVSGGSTFPLWVGGAVDLTLFNHIAISGGYGYMPNAYSQFIGTMVNKFSGQSIYGTMTQDALQSATAPRVSIDFKTSEYGWNIGVAAYFFSINGQADIVNTVQVATGIDLSVVRSLLASAGLNDPYLFLKGNMFIGEAHLGYTFKLMEHLGLLTNIGVAKIMSSSLTLSSSSSLVDSVPQVQSLYTSAQNQLKNILESNGITPIASLMLRLTF